MLTEAWMDGKDFRNFLNDMERQVRNHPQGHGRHQKEIRRIP